MMGMVTVNKIKYNQSKQENIPKVAVFTTGGTILSTYDPDTHTINPGMGGKELLEQALAGSKYNYSIELYEFCNMPGPHLTPELGVELARKIDKILQRDDIVGVVVTQGTDTLEEMSYLVHLLIDSAKPVVFTGAMKSMHELYMDARGNLLGAIQVAASKAAQGRGVMVYFNQEIHTAKDVVKSHASSIAAFRSPGFGPIGIVDGENVSFTATHVVDKSFPVENINPNVTLIKATFGMDDLLLQACLDANVAGIVMEGLGAGNLPPQTVPALKTALQRDIPVIMVSRCYEGRAMNIYGYEGGGAKLHDLGVILGGRLSGTKARIKLMVVLGYTKELEEIRKCFEGFESEA